MAYGYRLYRDGRKREYKRYTLDELKEMGTFQLRDICTQERIMTHQAGEDAARLGREELMELVYRYRGRPREALGKSFDGEGAQLMLELAQRSVIVPQEWKLPYKISLKKGLPFLGEPLLELPFADDWLCGFIQDREGGVRAVFELENSRMKILPCHVAQELEEGVYEELRCTLFDRASSLKAVRIYNEQKCGNMRERGLVTAVGRLSVLLVEKAPDAEEPLVIDLGASNTSAASEIDGQTIHVLFEDGSPFYPSAAAVCRCADGQAEWKFGPQALRWIKQDGYGSRMSFFYSLKGFLYGERMLQVYDREENGTCVSSDGMLKAYLEEVITQAQAFHGRRYTKLRFLMPYKREGLVLTRLQSLLPEYEVKAAGSEAVDSVLREAVGNPGDVLENGPASELVFHCGGGGVSLTECEYTAENTPVAYRLLLRERFLDADGSFGGNFLTYLLVKYLKARLYLKLEGEKRDLLGGGFLDPYSDVDAHGGTKEIYAELYRVYEEAEKRIPTRFQNAEKYSREAKENFYRLWFLAEGIKRYFFSGEASCILDLPEGFEELCSVHVLSGEGMREYPIRLRLEREQVEKLMAPEIYRVIKRFIEPLCGEDGILTGRRIRFCGLSCQIPVFRDAFREFTVGRRVRGKKGVDTGLKLHALEGDILQRRMLRNGTVVTEIVREKPAVPYLVSAQEHDGRKTVIVPDAGERDGVFGYITRHTAAREVEFEVENIYDASVIRKTVYLNPDRFEENGYGTLFSRFPALAEAQGDFDSIGREEMRLFVFREENWDFCVLPAMRQSGRLCTAEVERFLFDEDGADYFCGRF